MSIRKISQNNIASKTLVKDGNIYNSQILLLGNGANNSTTFTDSSVFNNTMSVFGDAKISTVQFPTGMSSSMLFDGTGDYLTATNNNFQPTNQNFTLEAYAYATANLTSTRQIIGCWGQVAAEVSYSIGVTNNNVAYLEFNTALWGAYYLITTANNIFTINAWNHIAAVRNGNVFTLYVNGTNRASTTTTGSLISYNVLSVAGNNKNNQYWNGYISNARIIVGAAVYTTNFTPPALPLANSILA